MALIEMEGGDHYGTGQFVQKGWTVNPDGQIAGRVRGLGWKATNSGIGNTVAKIFPSSYSTVYIGFGLAITGGLLPSSANKQVCQIYTGPGSQVCTIITDGSQRLAIQNAAGTTIATGTTNIALGSWYYIEIALTVGTSGTAELHLNGLSSPPEIPSTVGNFGTVGVGRIGFNRPPNNQSDVNWDDLYVLDNTGPAPLNNFLGDVTVETLYPVGDGAHQAWTPSAAGSHYSLVNEHPPDGDSSYVSDITPGDMDTYTVNSLAALTGTVYGVATNLYVRKDDATARTIAPVIRMAGVDYTGATTVGLTTSYLYYRQLYSQAPSGAAWTIANVNSSEYGIKEVI